MIWFDREFSTIATASTSPHDEEIAKALLPALAHFPKADLVLDGRPPSLRDSPMATYRLQRALGLPSAVPIAFYAPTTSDAAATLDIILDAFPGKKALHVATHADDDKTACIAIIVSSEPFTSTSQRLSVDDGDQSPDEWVIRTLEVLSAS